MSPISARLIVTDGERAKTLVGMAEGKRLTFQQPAKAS